MRQLYLILAILLIVLPKGHAQQGYQQTDSISSALYQLEQWPELLAFGETSIAHGDDFPNLRLRLGYAALQLKNYSKALAHYQKVLHTDHYNQMALYHAYWCNILLNRNSMASYYAKNLESKFLDEKELHSIAFNYIGTEMSYRYTNIHFREEATYNRLYTQLRLGYQLHIDQSISYFNQKVMDKKIQQPDYYIKLHYVPLDRLALIAAYNYSKSNFIQSIYTKNHTAVIGLKYLSPHFNTQFDVNLSKVDESRSTQFNLQSMLYFMGNLNVYGGAKISLLNNSKVNSFIITPLLGTKILPTIWLETFANLGKQYNFIDSEGLYVFNSIDYTHTKLNASAYFLIKKHLLLNIGYTFEDRTGDNLRFKYLQHAVNANVTWKF
ncbi:tetratricopeptide repeat protein [Pedobacter sp. ASV28]|uniref:tetratricopeptide repeat protein n=1 Tax=Pedobacter sp. ASV28 TaxID=2795123 RepID=UPI0018EB44E2|nr:hypothetical protein [Pedobacter sp. ASV28]